MLPKLSVKKPLTIFQILSLLARSRKLLRALLMGKQMAYLPSQFRSKMD